MKVLLVRYPSLLCSAWAAGVTWAAWVLKGRCHWTGDPCIDPKAPTNQMRQLFKGLP